jgi:hypothetical protein
MTHRRGKGALFDTATHNSASNDPKEVFKIIVAHCSSYPHRSLVA